MVIRVVWTAGTTTFRQIGLGQRAHRDAAGHEAAFLDQRVDEQLVAVGIWRELRGSHHIEASVHTST